MEKTPKASVIIPVYNVEKYLAECLDSVVNQTLRDIEIICVDDGSTDGSLKILMEYAQKDDRVKVICKDNGGQSSARNVGLDHALGEYIYFLDSDDKVELNMLEELTQEADRDQLDIIFFELQEFYDNDEMKEQFKELGNAVRSKEYGKNISGKQMFMEMVLNDDFHGSVVRQLFNRDFLMSHEFRFYEGIVHEDELYAFQTILSAQRVSHRMKQYYQRRIREGSTMTLPKSYRNFIGYFTCYKEMMAFVLGKGFASDVTECIIQRIDGIKRAAFRVYKNLPEEEQRGIEWTDDPFTLMLFKEYEEYPWEELAQGAELRGKVDRIKATLPGKILFKVYKGLRYLKKYGLKSTVKKTAEVFKRVTLRMLKK